MGIPEPWQGAPAFLEAPSPAGAIFYRRKQAPPHVVAFHDAICASLDSFLQDVVPQIAGEVAREFPALQAADLFEPGYLDKLIRIAVNGWVQRNLSDPDLDGLEAAS